MEFTPIDATCINSKYEQVTPPKDLKTILAVHDGTLVMSCTKAKIQVRYGLQVTEFKNNSVGQHAAMKDYGYSLMHSLSCAGLLD